MKRIGEDVSEKPDYVPGIFTVECHVRGQVGVRGLQNARSRARRVLAPRPHTGVHKHSAAWVPGNAVWALAYASFANQAAFSASASANA
jgi:hypothetical protein